MHVCRFTPDGTSGSRSGVVNPSAGTVTTVETEATTLEDELVDHDWTALVDAAGETTYDLAEVTFHAPVSCPVNLLGIGLNYAGHVEEGDHPIPEEPLFFAKSPSSITGPEETVYKHPEVNELHYEGELALVIGREAHRVPQEEAAEYIFGYMAGNDVTARDIQHRDLNNSHPWFRSKSMDTFTPLGPWVTPLKENSLNDVNLETRLNGETVQSSNTGDFIFGIADLLAYVSQHVTLHPGDVILTGTPAGIGEMKPSDEVVVEVDNVGTLENQVSRP